MKKTIKLLSILFLFAAISMSCEGPAGIDGIDGVTGADGTAICMTCHNAGTVYAAKVDQFNDGAHSLGTYFSRSEDCSGCHSTDGFLARMDFTSADEIFDLALTDQSAISCKACHMVHTTYDDTDWDLTFTDQVTETILGIDNTDVTSGEFEDMGDVNMCVQCHQSRNPTGAPSATSTADVPLSHYWGPHHGPQGNILNSQGGVEVGTGYPTSAFNPSTSFSHDCITCHMNEGNHSLSLDESACTSCHATIEDKLAAIQDEVEGKLTSLGRTLAALGGLDPDTETETVWNETLGEHVETIDTIGYHAMGSGYGGYGDNPVSANLGRCVFNYLIIAEDQSFGVHNPDYIITLLDNTITLAATL